MARKNSDKPGTCLHALRKNKKQIAGLFRDMLASQCAIWDKNREIEKIVGEIDSVSDLLESMAAGIDDPAAIENISTDEIIKNLEGCLCTPDEPAPED